MNQQQNRVIRKIISEISAYRSTIQKLTGAILIGAVLGALLGWLSYPVEFVLNDELAFRSQRFISDYKMDIVSLVFNGAVFGSTGGILLMVGILILQGSGFPSGQATERSYQNTIVPDTKFFKTPHERDNWSTMVDSFHEQVDAYYDMHQDCGECLESKVLLSIGDGIHVCGKLIEYDSHTITIQNSQGIQIIRIKFIASINLFARE